MFLALLFILSLGCTKQASEREAINLSVGGEISSIDPAVCFDAVCGLVVSPIYETLFEFEYLKRPYELRPLLAESLPEISPDRLKYVFKIKKGIRYHSSPLLAQGREVVAKDFITQIKRLSFMGTINSRGWWLFDDKIKGINLWRDRVKDNFELFFTEQIQGLYAPDDYTLVFELNRPYPQLLYALSMSFTTPIPEEAVKATNNDFGQKEVGTGAFFITSFNPAQAVELAAFPEYKSSLFPTEGTDWAKNNGLLKDAGAQLPLAKKAKIVVIKEAQTDWLNFLKKKIDQIIITKDHYQIALNPDGTLKNELIKDQIQLQASPTLIYWWIAFNLKDPVLGNNLNLRKAIAHAINIKKYIELFTYNTAEEAHSIYPPGIPGYDPQTKLPYRYDLKLAKEYLAKAGYPDGKGLPTLRFDIRGSDTRRRQMGEFIQQELRALNIKVEVVINTFPGFIEKTQKGTLQFWQGGWVLDYPDAENVLQLLATQNLPPGQNYSNFSNAEFDRLFNEVRIMEDGPQKFELMRKMENIVNSELPWVMQYYSRNYVLSHAYLKNFMYSDIIYNNLKYLKLDPQAE